MSAAIVKLGARSFGRFLAPITMLTLVVFTPFVYLALHVKVPTNAPQAREVLRAAWVLAAAALFCTLGLVGAIAPLVRSVAAKAPLAQHRALWAGLVGLVHALVPTLVAAIGIALGLVAFAVPGIMLLMLFSLVAASDALGVRARLAESVAVVRAQLVPTIVVVGAAVTLAVLVILVQQLGLPSPIPKHPKPAQLVAFTLLVRRAAWVLVVAAPVFATALAAIHASAVRRDR